MHLVSIQGHLALITVFCFNISDVAGMSKGDLATFGYSCSVRLSSGQLKKTGECKHVFCW
jgi:hypothetical protein